MSINAEQIHQFWRENKTMVCEQTHTRMTRRACLVRQGLLPRSEERGPIRHVPIECRDCPQGKRIAQEEKQEKMAARQKSYEGPFACAKCGEGEEEGRTHGGRGLCTRCYAAETKKGTLSKWRLSPPIPEEREERQERDSGFAHYRAKDRPGRGKGPGAGKQRPLVPKSGRPRIRSC